MTDQSTKLLCAFVIGAFTGALIEKVYIDVKNNEQMSIDPEIAAIDTDANSQRNSSMESAMLVERASYNVAEHKEQINEDPPVKYTGVEENMKNTKSIEVTKDPGVELVSGDELEDGYESIALTYYTEDDLLVDEMDAPIDNVRALLGDKFYTEINSDIDDTLYVRNDKVKAIFEVCVVHGPSPYWAGPHE